MQYVTFPLPLCACHSCKIIKCYVTLFYINDLGMTIEASMNNDYILRLFIVIIHDTQLTSKRFWMYLQRFAGKQQQQLDPHTLVI